MGDEIDLEVNKQFPEENNCKITENSRWKLRSNPYHQQATPRFLERIWYEIYLSWRFIRSNFPPAVITGAAFAVSAWHVANATLWQLPLILLLGAVNGWLMLYFFDLINQVVGIEEDRINKPHRPIPAGLCSLEQAERRIPYAAFAYLGFAIAINATTWALVWIVTVTAYNYWGLDRHWVTKTLFTCIGALLCAPIWIFVNGSIDSIAQTWLISVFVYWIICSVLQDLRDLAGDRSRNRRTLPMVIGDRASRYIAAVVLMLQPAFSLYHWPCGANLLY